MPKIHYDPAKNVKKYILKIQGEAKSEKGIAQYSLQKTIDKIILDHKRFSLQKKSLAPE